jgi:hypothetical protein
LNSSRSSVEAIKLDTAVVVVDGCLISSSCGTVGVSKRTNQREPNPEAACEGDVSDVPLLLARSRQPGQNKQERFETPNEHTHASERKGAKETSGCKQISRLRAEAVPGVKSGQRSAVIPGPKHTVLDGRERMCLSGGAWRWRGPTHHHHHCTPPHTTAAHHRPPRDASQSWGGNQRLTTLLAGEAGPILQRVDGTYLARRVYFTHASRRASGWVIK